MDGKDNAIASGASDVERGCSADDAVHNRLQSNKLQIETDCRELDQLAERIKNSDIEFRISTERMSDPIAYLMKTSSQDKCVIANALMETTIRYIGDNFKGAYLDWESSDDPYKDIKIGILEKMGYVEGSHAPKVHKKNVIRVASVCPQEEHRYRPPFYR